MKADVLEDKKSRDRKEGVAPDERYGDISNVWVDDPMSQNSFGDKEFTEPSALTKCNDDAMANESAEVPKPHISPV